MPKLVVFLVLFAAAGFGQTCKRYGAPTTLAGTLFVKDEAGYNQFIALKLAQPICTALDPIRASDPGLQYEHVYSRVRVVQAGVYGGDVHSGTLRDQLDRLVAHRVMIQGVLFHAHTGYHRTVVQLSVEAVDAIDAAGRQALRVTKPEGNAQNVPAFDVTVNAGRRLVLEARETGSARQLLPSFQYVSHYMTGGEVLYVDCRDGYERRLISTTEKAGICFDGDDPCGLQAFPIKPIILKFRCTKNP